MAVRVFLDAAVLLYLAVINAVVCGPNWAKQRIASAELGRLTTTETLFSCATT